MSDSRCCTCDFFHYFSRIWHALGSLTGTTNAFGAHSSFKALSEGVDLNRTLFTVMTYGMHQVHAYQSVFAKHLARVRHLNDTSHPRSCIKLVTVGDGAPSQNLTVTLVKEVIDFSRISICDSTFRRACDSLQPSAIIIA